MWGSSVLYDDDDNNFFFFLFLSLLPSSSSSSSSSSPAVVVVVVKVSAPNLGCDRTETAIAAMKLMVQALSRNLLLDMVDALFDFVFFCVVFPQLARRICCACKKEKCMTAFVVSTVQNNHTEK